VQPLQAIEIRGVHGAFVNRGGFRGQGLLP
jgi:hypothetical protein